MIYTIKMKNTQPWLPLDHRKQGTPTEIVNFITPGVHQLIYPLIVYSKQLLFVTTTNRKKRISLTKDLKNGIFTACIVRVSRGSLRRGAFVKVARNFDVHPKTVPSLWKTTLAIGNWPRTAN
jgi:hypothetical protein